MTTANFRVSSDLTVGNLVINATTGDITTSGNVTVTGSGSINTGALGVSSIAKNDSSITINDVGTGSSIDTVVDGTQRAALSASGLSITGTVTATSFSGSGAGLTNIPGSAIVGGVGGSGNITIGTTTINSGGTSTTLAGLTSVSSSGFTGALTGNASTATKLAAPVYINSTAFDGSANVTVAAAAGTLTGTTLASGVTASSLTSLGTLTGLTMAGDILPSTTLTYKLGSPTMQWHSVYVGPGSLYVNNQKVLQDESGTIVFSADTNQNISIQTKGSGVTELAPDTANGGYISLKSTVQMLAGYHLTTSDASALGIPSGIATDSISAHSTNATLNINQQGSGVVSINSPTTITGATSLTANVAATNSSTGTLKVTGGLGVTGDVYAGGVQNTPIGSTTPSTGSFTTLAASGIASVTNSTAATGANTGALRVTGGASFGNDIYISGNLIISGNLDTASSSVISVNDPMIYLGQGNASDVVDLGVIAAYNNGFEQHTGIIRDASDSTWKFFDAVSSEPTSIVNFASANYANVKMGNLAATGGAFSGNVSASLFTGSGAGLTNIPSSAISGSMTGNVTIGSTTINLGGTATTIAGLTSLTSTNLTGTLQTGAQTNITSVGTLGNLSVSGTVTAGTFSGAGTNLSGTAASLTAGSATTATTATKVTLTSDATHSSSPIMWNDGAGNCFYTPGVSIVPTTGAVVATLFTGAHNGSVGATTPSTGAFTTVSASGVITSTVSTGTAPLTVASTTMVTNLNADLLDGLQSATAATASTIAARDSSGNFAANAITGTSFTGAGTGLTGTAASLSIGGSAASATTATNLAGGAAGSIPVQTGSGATSFIAAGTSGYVLTSTGTSTAPTWQVASGGGGASLSTANNWTAAQRGAVSALTAGTTVTPNFALANNFSLTAGQNFTMAFPTNVVAGQSGIIAITQDGTGGRVVTWASGWVAAGGTKPVLTTTGSAVDYISYYAETGSRVFISIYADVK